MQRRGLVFLGQTDGTAADTTRIRDAIRLGQSTRASTHFGDAYLRIQGTGTDAASDPQYIGKVEWLDPATGDLFTSPNTAAVVNSGKRYEVWMHGIWPDDVDRAIDRALTEKCTLWRMKPVTMVTDIELIGANQNASVAVQTLGFPTEYFSQSMLVTNTAANGSGQTSSLYVQPGQTLRIFGFVSARTGTAKVRLRDITNGADINIPSNTFTLRGWRFFLFEVAVPAGCQEVQFWPGGVANGDVTEWAGCGLIASGATQFILPARVRNEHEVGQVFALGPSPTTGLDLLRRVPLDGISRERAGGAVRLWGDGLSAPGFGLYYEELSHYAPFVTINGITGLTQTGSYFSAVGRQAADNVGTDCDIRYLEAASVVELLKSSDDQDLKRVYEVALSDLAALELRHGATPRVVQEHTRPYMMRGATLRM